MIILSKVTNKPDNRKDNLYLNKVILSIVSLVCYLGGYIVQLLWLPRGGYVKVRAISEIFSQLYFIMYLKQHIKTLVASVAAT